MDMLKLADELEYEEGNVAHVYQDHLGFWTIGIGFLVDKRKGGKLYPEEIAFIFQNRMNKKYEELDQRIPWFHRLDDARQRVLMQMAYQMGTDGLLGFVNTLKMVEAGDYQGAAKGMLNSKWAKQTPDRARRLSKMMETGVPPAEYGTA